MIAIVTKRYATDATSVAAEPGGVSRHHRWTCSPHLKGGRPMAEDNRGPFLNLATICERVLREADGTLSLIRMIDRYTVAIQGADAPESLPPTRLDLNLVVGFRAGVARGRATVSIRAETPDGQKKPTVSGSVLFEGEEHGAQVIANISLDADQEGLYWFDV